MEEVSINVLLGKNQVICARHDLLMDQERLWLLRLSLGARSDVVRLHLPLFGDLGVEAQPRGATMANVRDDMIAGIKSRCSLIFWQHRLAIYLKVKDSPD
jgi:hypothetical protein